MMIGVLTWSLILKEEFEAQVPTAEFPEMVPHLIISVDGDLILIRTPPRDPIGVLQEGVEVLMIFRASVQIQAEAILHSLIQEVLDLQILAVEAVISLVVVEAEAVVVLVGLLLEQDEEEINPKI